MSTKQKNPPVSDQVLIDVWTAGARSGKSKSEIFADLSERVGFTVNDGSMTQRITALRSRIRRGSTEVESDGMTMSFEKYCLDNDLKLEDNDPHSVDGLKVVREGVEIPKLKTGGGRPAKSVASLTNYLNGLLNPELPESVETEAEVQAEVAEGTDE